MQRRNTKTIYKLIILAMKIKSGERDDKVILRRDSDILQGGKLVCELKIQTDNAESRVFINEQGCAYFLGNASDERKINWVNFFTGKEANNSIYIDYKNIINEDITEFQGMFVQSEKLKSDDAVIFDLDKFRKLDEDYINLIFQISTAYSVDVYRQFIHDNVVETNYNVFEPFSRMRVNVSNVNKMFIAERFNKSLVCEEQILKVLNSKEKYVAYSIADNKAVAAGKVIDDTWKDSDRFDTLSVVCRASKDTKAMVDLNDCVTIVGNSGYLYLEPFSVSHIDISNTAIEIIANRKMDLEIFDPVRNCWDAFKKERFGQYSNMQYISLRIAVSVGDYVRNVIIKKCCQ